MKPLKDLLFIFLLTTVCTTILVLSESVYRVNAAADPLLMRRTLQLLPGITGPLDPNQNVQSQFNTIFEPAKSRLVKGNSFACKSKPHVYVREEGGTGLWGEIKILLAFDVEAQTVLGIDVLFNSETPGLGSRIEEPSFKAQFVNLKAPSGVKLAKIKFQDGEFDGVTGATITSAALERICNQAISNIRRLDTERIGKSS